MAKSALPAKSRYPRTPPYNPRRVSSTSSINSMARTFGAPDSVPAGKHAVMASSAVLPSANDPDTVDTRCMTWL
ncbi:Uncharacterised protein [Mycobacteroides abscessus subsp. abscessus]|nr:Uncharacterised protein [Mycobacteroides abscessus subsp. abscessus]